MSSELPQLDTLTGKTLAQMAISTESKNFIASPIVQKVVNDLYSGRVVYSTAAIRSILADNYKHRGIHVSGLNYLGSTISLML